MYYNNNYYFSRPNYGYAYGNPYGSNFSRRYHRVVVYNRNFAEFPKSDLEKEFLVRELGSGADYHLVRGLTETGDVRIPKDKTEALYNSIFHGKEGRVEGLMSTLEDIDPALHRELGDNPKKFIHPTTYKNIVSRMKEIAQDKDYSAEEKRREIAHLRAGLYEDATQGAVNEASNQIAAMRDSISSKSRPGFFKRLRKLFP